MLSSATVVPLVDIPCLSIKVRRTFSPANSCNPVWIHTSKNLIRIQHFLAKGRPHDVKQTLPYALEHEPSRTQLTFIFRRCQTFFDFHILTSCNEGHVTGQIFCYTSSQDMNLDKDTMLPCHKRTLILSLSDAKFWHLHALRDSYALCGSFTPLMRPVSTH